MDEDENYPGITQIALRVADAEATEDFANEASIAITGRRDFRGVKTIFIRDPDRNVLDLIGPGPSAAETIARRKR